MNVHMQLMLAGLSLAAYIGVLSAMRVPYAAAREGRFFKPFARLHPAGNFPSFSVVFLGVNGGVWLEHMLTSLPGGAGPRSARPAHGR